MAIEDIGISGEKIVAIGGRIRGKQEIFVEGKIITPGGVDVHVHLSPPRDPRSEKEVWVDDFYTGSVAALAGGITTIGNMTFQWPGQTLEEALARDMEQAEASAVTDFFLHPVLTSPTASAISEIPGLASRGIGSLKVFLVNEAFDREVDSFLKAIRIAGQLNMLVMLHCEDGPLIRSISSEMIENGLTSARYWAESRPSFAEAIAVRRAAAIAKATGAHVYIVHLSSAAALEACAAAKQDGIAVYVETRPMYLHLTNEKFKELDGAKYVGAPPLRTHEDVAALWRGLVDGTIDTIASDHAPWSLKAKLDPALDITSLRQGVADLETSLPLVFAKGVGGGILSLSRFVALVSSTPARLFGLWPKKGCIALGSDADIVIWDSDHHHVIDGSSMYSRAGYSVYDGQEVIGRPVITISRGTVVMRDGRVTADRGRGSWLAAGVRL